MADRARRATAGHAGAATADHAGSLLCRLLISHPDVVDIEILGQAEMFPGIISYSLGVLLPGGRELYIDVEDARYHRCAAGCTARAPAGQDVS